MQTNDKYFQLFTQPTQRLQTLIIGRLMATFLLLVASWFWNSGNVKLSFEDFPRGLFFVFLISVGLTIIYFFVMRLNKSYRWQIRIQFFLDALLITWLVWRTGDLTSPFITLYIVLIGVASLFLPSLETLLTAVLCLCLFILLSVVVTVLPHYSIGGTVPEMTKAVQIISFHTVAFLVVGLLAARLSSRHASGEQLKEATKSLASLRALHERIVQSIRSGLITTDLEGNIYTFNTAAEEITGYKAELMQGRTIFSLFGSIEQSIVPAVDATLEGEPSPRHETDIMTPDGFAVHVGYGISPLFSETGEMSGLIITFQDLTEVRSMEESVRRKDRLAAVGRVAAGLAHEIRNPLGAMRGAIQVLQSQTPPDTAQASLMEIILRESDRLNKIITNFLTYARPRVNNFSEIDVREAIQDTFTLLKHSPDVLDGHSFEFKAPENPVLISADPTQLKQIFWNLARNSLNAMREGGKLSVELANLPSKRIQIIFTDTGCGMSPEQVERLFEPFSDSTTGGTGLGLSIVYQIVRDHSGTINVRSRENDGTTITVELPCEFRSANGSIESENGEAATQPSRLESFLTVKSNERN
jgi:two-component system sensor histidine kinase PilS (NtrC family)